MNRKTIVGLWIPAMAGLAVGTWRRYFARPRLEEHADLFEPGVEPDFTGVRATFLGCTGLVLDDGNTAIMIDGFFTRPKITRLFTGRIAPDENLVAEGLRRAGVDGLAAVYCGHAHYDHALDAPAVAVRTGAVLVGSSSIANIGKGYGLPDDRVSVPGTRVPKRFGEFTVTLFPSGHSPKPRWPGAIEHPLRPPAKVSDYAMGECHTMLVEHRDRRILVHTSAGFEPGALAGVRADVVYLAIGALGRQDEDYRAELWREVVEATGARRVVLTHWDDFTRSLERPLVPPPRAVDDFATSLRSLSVLADASGVDLRLPVLWRPTDPFRGAGGRDSDGGTGGDG